MTVHIDDMPAECLEFLVKRFRSDHVGGSAVDLQSVDIDDRTEIVALVVSSSHCGFPDLAFLAFAVADQAVNAVILAGKFIGDCHAVCRRKSLTEGACAHVDAGREVHIGMTLQAAVDLTEREQLLFRDDSFFRKRRVEQRGGMSLGENEPVAVRDFHGFPCRVFRGDIHDLKKQQCHDFRCAERAARMSAFRVGNLTDDIPPDIPRVKFQFFIVHK